MPVPQESYLLEKKKVKKKNYIKALTKQSQWSNAQVLYTVGGLVSCVEYLIFRKLLGSFDTSLPLAFGLLEE